MTSLAGRVVMVTGACGGLGRAFTTALAEAGADLVLTGRDAVALKTLARELETRRVRVLPIVADLTLTDAMPEAVEQAVATFGSIDVLVNNAGTGGPLGPLWEVDVLQWWHTMEINLLGVVRACQAVLPVMIARRGGAVVNIVSAAGWFRWPHVSAYSVSKAAVIKLTENLAAELRGHGVSALSFHPGLVEVGLTGDAIARGHIGDRWADHVLDWFLAQREAGHFVPVERSARALVHLVGSYPDQPSGGYLTPDDVLAP